MSRDKQPGVVTSSSTDDEDEKMRRVEGSGRSG